MIPPQLLFGAVALLALTITASAIAVPANWGDDEVADVTATAKVTWHGIRKEWTVDQVELRTSESRILNVRAFFTNTLGFTSDGETVVLRIETPGGVLVQEETDRTGRGVPFLDDEKTLSVVFRQVPFGDYVLRVGILEPDGSLSNEAARDVRLIPEAQS